MFLQNRRFADTETLLEVLFDLELGITTPELQTAYEQAQTALAGNAEFQKALAALEDEEDRMEEADDAKREVVAELLGEKFSQFKVENRQLFGLPAAGEPVLLCSIDLV